ncbi:MAG: hypothetical protein ACXAE3_12670 [Candidatus Kariarchaeaceae archaeon]|jgi:hypothetical protein
MKYVRSMTLLFLLVILSLSSPVAAEYPTNLDYSYSWFSYWCGSTLLEAEFREGDVTIDYEVFGSSGYCDIQPFNESFTLTLDNVYVDIDELFASSIDSTELHNWSTTYGTRDEAWCDGGGYSKEMTMYFPGETHTVEDLLDNDSCSGGYTIKSHDDIQIQLDFLHNLVINLIEGAQETTTTGSLSVPNIITLIPVLVLLQRRKSFNPF